MIEVYIFGCSTCGTNAMLLNRLKKTHGEVTVYNSVKPENRDRHLGFLNRAGIEINNYPAIVVVNSGERIIRLSEWKLL